MSSKKQEKNQNNDGRPLGYFRGYPKKKSEPKREAEADLKNHKKIEKCTSGNCVLIILAFLTALVTGTIVYAIYNFVHVSRLSEVAGIHVTPSLKKAANELLNGENKSLAGYEDWLDYHNDSFDFKYPSDWKLKNDADVSIRKFNSKTYGYFDSLAVDINIKTLDNTGSLPLIDYLNKNKLETGEKKEETIGGKNVLRTGVFEGSDGLMRRAVYWPMMGKILYLEAIFYNNNYEENFGDFEKIVQSVKIL
jgi:hypothetical protein